MRLPHLFSAAAALTALAACAPHGSTVDKPSQSAVPGTPAALTFTNEQFYKDGKFDEEAAKDAVVKLMHYYAYPVTAKTRDALWVSDYGTGKFIEVGLAAIMIDNNTHDRYMLQHLFLLPHQMLPEHMHKKPANSDLPAKMEGWWVHNGATYTVGEGADNLKDFSEVKIPSAYKGELHARHVVKLSPGEFDKLGKVFGWHWQIAGPAGAIITEVANVHDGPSVCHAVPSINEHFLKPEPSK